MGRDKGQGRVKGNAKPASSGRSAELATTAGTLTFASLSTGSASAAFVPLIPEPDDTGLDPAVALILRKLGKKDTTTKLKALAELSDTCKNDETLPMVVLPYWPKIYARLAVDDSRKVRELAHGLLETIATAVGRKLAPQTKLLIPTLFLSVSDTFAPAASAARSAFSSIFPTEEKQKQAITFCLAELSTILNERLIYTTELGKITYLDGLNRLLRLGIVEELYETLDFALTHQAFWAMGTNEAPVVRKTFFDVVSSIAETAGNRIPKSKLAATLKQGFESERVEVQSLWNCFLTLAINGVVEEKGTAEAQIILCTKNSFYGHASQLGPLLLPIVAKLGVPPQIFESIEEGFILEKSHVERQAIVRTYAEILSFYYKETEKIPESAFPFVTSQLATMTEFGRTLSALVKKDAFYDSFAQFCLDRTEVMQNPNLGAFIISFFKDKRSVKFSNTNEQKSVYESIVQKEFLRKLSLGMLHVKNYVAFGVIARWLSGSSFLSELFTPSDIPNLFNFGEEDDKVVQLRLSLELIKSFPESPETLALLASIFPGFKDSTEHLEVFAREIEPFDKIPEFKRWLKSGVFNDEVVLKSNALSKYVLGRKEIFGEGMVQAKLELLVSCPQDHLDLARELLHDTSGSSVDMTPFFIAIWDAFLDDKSGDNSRLEETACQIVQKRFVPKSVLYSRINENAGEVERLEDLTRLIGIAQKLMSEQQVDVDEISVAIDPDLLTFRGFGFSTLKTRDFTIPADFDVSKVLRQVILNAEVILDDDVIDEDEMGTVGSNLLYADTLVDISKDAKRRTWESSTIGTTEAEIYDKVTTLLSNILEQFAKSNQLKQFWKHVLENTSDAIWNSKYPAMKLLKICQRMELPCPRQFIPNELNDLLKEISSKSVLDLVHKIKMDENPPYEKVIEIITAKRNQNPELFHFDAPFNTLQEENKDQLIGILEIVIALIGKNVEFASVASCWVSAWLKQAADKYDSDKTSFLWISKLSHAVVLLTKFSKTETPFSVEFAEFHALNIFPAVYKHFLQLAASEEYWAIEAAENVAEAVRLIPVTILNSLLEEPSKAFELFLPVTLRPEIIFKVAGHSLLSKVTLTKEILPREFESFSKRFRRGGPRSEEAKVSFLLLWDSLLRAQPNAFELANYVKEDYLLPQALNLIFGDILDSSAIPSLKTYFELEPTITCRSLSPITHLAAWVLQNILRMLPYTVRWWWASLGNKGTKAHVERITTKFLSAKLAAEELNKVKWGDGEGDNVTVNSHPGCNELIARYKIEETSVTLKITLPLNHPLGPVTVVASDKKIHARISQLLNTRSHSLAAGLRIWKESLDTVYKDADECAICFFILQHQTKQLPKLGCKTCKKKFHAACLYKWFSTSNKSECPLCRNLW